jgi:hypothetical protein
MSECPICIDKFTNSVRKELACPHCQNACCTKCVQRYLLESAKDPHCLHCMKEWSRQFLQNNLPKSFIDGDYAKRRADILWSKAESFIPDVQTKALNIKKSEEFEEKYIFPVVEVMDDLKAKKRMLEEELYKLERELYKRRTIKDDIQYGRTSRENNDKINETVEKKEENKFKRKCTVPDCEGWLSSAWKCGLCENFTCPDCFEIKGKKKDGSEASDGTVRQVHTCKVEDLETANLIRSSTKPCPKCGYAIEKNQGCNVMFCTSCHSGFDWTTGKILQTAQIHNPHYFEWLNRNGGTNQDQPIGCDDQIQGRMVNRVAPSLRPIFGAIINRILHVEDWEFRNYSYHITHQNDEDLLIEYLLKKKTKDEVKRSLQNRERRMERERAIRDILEMFVRIGKERVLYVINNSSEITNIIKEMEDLREFANDLLVKVGHLHGCKVPHFMGWDKVETIDPK